MIQAVVMDIEGTTSSAEYVQQHLFSYSRQRVGAWLADRRGTPEATAVLGDVRAVIGRDAADEAEVVERLISWIDADVKMPSLKRLQGTIWHDGFQAGELRAHVYPDVPPSLAKWAVQEIRLHTYSSGSVAAQRDWFTYSDQGDLTGYLDRHFDLDNAGPKQNPRSYRAINMAIEVPPSATLFLADSAAELDAAAAAGWVAVGIDRSGKPRTTGDHRWIKSFNELEIEALTTR